MSATPRDNSQTRSTPLIGTTARVVAVLLLAAWLGHWALHAAHQRRTAEYLEGLGGLVRDSARLEYAWVPAGVKQWAGEDYFREIRSVTLGAGVTDEQFGEAIGRLRRLSSLESVDVWDAGVTDKDLGQLTKLTQISRLGLQFAQQPVRGTGLEHITGMDNLRELRVSGSSIQNESLTLLPEFKSLEVLVVGGNRIDDAGLSYLSENRTIKRLILSGCRCSAAGLQAILQMENLESLTFHNMGFAADVAEDQDMAALLESDRQILSGTGPTSPYDFTSRPAQYEALRAWLIGKRPGLKVNWEYFG